MSATAYRDTAHTNNYEFTSGAGYVLPEYAFVPPPELQDGDGLVRHPIVIVGGGITGLTLACSLARLGVRAVLLDEDNTVGVKGASSRGICYTQKSLEIFQRLGIYERIATAWGSAVRSIFIFTNGATYTPRYNIFGLAQRAWDKLMPFHFNRELAKALETSKYRGRS